MESKNQNTFEWGKKGATVGVGGVESQVEEGNVVSKKKKRKKKQIGNRRMGEVPCKNARGGAKRGGTGDN